MSGFVVGQRWSSSSEPELGVGFLLAFDNFTVSIFFPASDSHRKYNIDSAPIFRVVYGVGDKIYDMEGNQYIVTSIVEKDGILSYVCNDKIVGEGELNDKIVSPMPNERLKKGDLDHLDEYQLRCDLLKVKEEIDSSTVKGFIGPKIDLIDHQLYIADKISKSKNLSALLSDETGLGKTIEAALTIHRLLLIGRVSRVLIIVPKSLVYQWFVELYRKFNLNFTIIDPDNFDSETLDQTQLFITSYSNLETQKEVLGSIFNSSFDLLVVDEAHHITDNENRYEIFKHLASKIEGKLLLSATPEQLGNENHFRRLNLLDPIKYNSYQRFQSEQQNYSDVSHFIERVESYPAKEYKSLIKDDTFYNQNSDVVEYLSKSSKSKTQFIENSLELFSVGRSIYRNSRKNIKGFPKRVVEIVPLKSEEKDLLKVGCELFGENSHKSPNSVVDSVNSIKCKWISELLKSNKNEKFLLICSSKDKSISINNSLKTFINARSAMFHEDLTILQRDKNSSYFSDEDGAQILICSEIGSEGRNFQFANNLILFDIPLNPELIEQRIGRLDRIGQKNDIKILIPTIDQSIEHNLTLWYHKGMNIFKKNISGSYQIFNRLKDQLKERLLSNTTKKELDTYIKESKERVNHFSSLIENGRDTILERNSFDKKISKQIKDEIKGSYRTDIKLFLEQLFGHFGISFDRFDKEVYKLDLQLMNSNEFPIELMKNEYHNFTFDRTTASIDESLDFITWDHPIVREAIDLYLLSSTGNCGNVSVELGFDAFILESNYIFESTASKLLGLDRFIDKNLINIQVDHNLRALNLDLSEYKLEDDDGEILENRRFQQQVLTSMIDRGEEVADYEKEEMISLAIKKVESIFDPEIDRVKTRENLGIIENFGKSDSLINEKQILIDHLKECVVRLDSVMLIRSY